MPTPVKPIELKKLQGTYRKDRDEGAATITDQRKPTRPAWLSERAKPIWSRLAPVLFESRLLTYADREQFAAYCEAVAQMIEVQEAYQKSLQDLPGSGLMIKTEKGYMANPLIAQARLARDQVIKVAREFGMTPSARSGIKLPGEAEKELELADVLFKQVESLSK